MLLFFVKDQQLCTLSFNQCKRNVKVLQKRIKLIVIIFIYIVVKTFKVIQLLCIPYHWEIVQLTEWALNNYWFHHLNRGAFPILVLCSYSEAISCILSQVGDRVSQSVDSRRDWGPREPLHVSFFQNVVCNRTAAIVSRVVPREGHRVLGDTNGLQWTLWMSRFI